MTSPSPGGKVGREASSPASSSDALSAMIEKMTSSIRRATLEDASLLAGLGARTFYDAFAADIKAEDMTSYLATAFSPAKQAAELADPHTTFLIAEDAGVARGYAQLRAGEAPPYLTGSKPMELVRIYVSQEWLGRGVGAALMRACLEEAQKAGHDTLWLGVWEHNGRAQAFYRKWGFHKVGEHTFQLGSEAQIDHLMARGL